MRQIIVILVSLSLSIVALAHSEHDHGTAQKPSASAKTFGGKIVNKKVITLSEATKNFDKYKGKTITVQATAKKVCEKKGCWMVISDGDKEIRTLFKDYGFFVPANILDKKVMVQGKLEQKKVSAATIRHFMKDGGASRKEINKVKKGKMKFQFTADAVEII